jgi:hypothetical protein
MKLKLFLVVGLLYQTAYGQDKNPKNQTQCQDKCKSKVGNIPKQNDCYEDCGSIWQGRVLNNSVQPNYIKKYGKQNFSSAYGFTSS